MTAPTYNGNAANISPAAAVNVASSTNATPIVFQTSAPHGLLDKQDVEVQGHAVNTAGNGVWQIGFVDSTHFQALGSVGNGVGGATGSVQSLTPTGFVTLVDGTVAPTAGAFNTPSQANLDIGAYLFEKTGAYKLVKYARASNTDDTQSAWDTFTFAANGTWTQSASNTLIAAVNSAPFINQGDVIEIDFDVSVAWITAGTGGSSSAFQLGLFASMFAPGVAPPAAIRVPGSAHQAGISNPSVAAGGSNQSAMALHLSAAFAAGSGAFPTGNSLGLNLYVQARTFGMANISSQLVSMTGDYVAQVRVFRLTGVPQ
jgi:hypothetical protein